MSRALATDPTLQREILLTLVDHMPCATPTQWKLQERV
jgi:hypothetical protein